MSQGVMAVVVTYNRLELLKENIDALCKQEYVCDILIINNASTDGTVEKIPAFLNSRGYLYQKEKNEDVFCRDNHKIYFDTLEDNIGGAGGFSYGMKRAVKLGYEYIWIMDDDTIPHKDSLSKLMENTDSKFGFLSSTVIWKDGSPCLMNKQHVISDDDRRARVDTATFVSLLFSRDVVIEMGLPIKEYFIWGDDKEYTNRLAKRYDCYWIKDSVVTHKMNVNAGSNITTDELSKVPRYYYAYRNDYVTARQQGVVSMLIYQLAFYLNMYRVKRFAVDGVKERIDVMKRGRAAGRSFYPEIEYIE